MCCFNFLYNNSDIISAFLFTLLGFFLTILYTFIYRPCLEIVSAEYIPYDKNTNPEKKEALSILVKNKSVCFGAVNLNIEACAVANNYTYHFEIDKSGFLILPPKNCKVCKSNERKFKCIDILQTTRDTYNISFADIVQDIKDGSLKLRIRIHANHSFSGFGRATEEIFEYKKKDEKFIKI